MQDDGSGSSTDGVLGLNGNKIHYKLRFNEELQDSNEGWGTGRTYPEFEEQGPRENDIYRYSFVFLYIKKKKKKEEEEEE